MAIYHLTAKVHSRSAGRSAVACAAYRSRDRLTDERAGETWDYRNKGPEESEILAPENAPEWARDREQLWNQVEACEKRKDAQVAREIEVALPKELTPEQQRELVREFARENFVERGVVVDAAYHRSNEENPHAHLLITTRPVEGEGFGKKDREMNSKEALERWRESWERDANRALERAGREERIDHRSLKDQGILDREPTKHEGPHVRAMEERGERTELGEYNRAVREHNSNVIDFQKAKEEAERLRPIHERHQERMKEGYWSQEGSQAIARLEERHGGPVTREEIERQRLIHDERSRNEEKKAKELEGRRKSLESQVAYRHRGREEYEELRKQFNQENTFGERLKAHLQFRGKEHDRHLESLAFKANMALSNYQRGGWGETEGLPPHEAERLFEQVKRAAEAQTAKAEKANEEARLWRDADEAWDKHDRNRAERDPDITRRYQDRLESRCYYQREAQQLRAIEGSEGREMSAPELRQKAAELKQAEHNHTKKANELERRARDLDSASDKARELHHALPQVTREQQARDTLKERARRLISPTARREYRELEQRQEQIRKGLAELQREHGTTDPRRLGAASKEAQEQSNAEKGLARMRGYEAQSYESAAYTMDRAAERGRYRAMTPEQRRGYDRQHPYKHFKRDLQEIKLETMKRLQPERYERIVERAIEQARDYGRDYGPSR
jgi:hypothetical protein